MDVVSGPPPRLSWCRPVQEVLRAILANWGFLGQFKEGRSYGGWSRLQENIVFSCNQFTDGEDEFVPPSVETSLVRIHHLQCILPHYSG